MTTIIAGGRDFSDREHLSMCLAEELRYGWHISRVVSGCARGADALGEDWAKTMHIAVDTFPADWNKHGKSAGYIRNANMAEHAETLIAFWDGKSKGTKHMIDLAIKQGLYVKVFYYDQDL